MHSARTTEGRRWERRRIELLPWPHHRRDHVAKALGITQRTIERYETGDAPAWYDLALVGLAAKLAQGKKRP